MSRSYHVIPIFIEPFLCYPRKNHYRRIVLLQIVLVLLEQRHFGKGVTKKTRLKR